MTKRKTETVATNTDLDLWTAKVSVAGIGPVRALDPRDHPVVKDIVPGRVPVIAAAMKTTVTVAGLVPATGDVTLATGGGLLTTAPGVVHEIILGMGHGTEGDTLERAKGGLSTVSYINRLFF